MIRVDAVAGSLDVLEEGFDARDPVTIDLADSHEGIGREMFEIFRKNVGLATEGAAVIL